MKIAIWLILLTNLLVCCTQKIDRTKNTKKYEVVITADDENTTLYFSDLKELEAKFLDHARSEDWKIAEQLAVRYIEIKPDDWNMRRNFCLVFHHQKKYEIALDCLYEALDVVPADKMEEAYGTIAGVYFASRDYDTSMHYYNKAIELNQNNPDYFLNRAIIHSLHRNWRNMCADFDAFLDLTGDFEQFDYYKSMTNLKCPWEEDFDESFNELMADNRFEHCIVLQLREEYLKSNICFFSELGNEHELFHLRKDIIYTNIALNYNKMLQLDSAAYYYSKAYELSGSLHPYHSNKAKETCSDLLNAISLGDTALARFTFYCKYFLNE